MQLESGDKSVIGLFFLNFSCTIQKFRIFAAGKSYTTSSCQTPPGSEGSKGRWLSGAI